MNTNKTQNLLTKFFYLGNNLHFQILVLTEIDWVIYDEYDNYGEYLKAFNEIQNALVGETKVVKMTEKNKNLETAFANVAWF